MDQRLFKAKLSELAEVRQNADGKDWRNSDLPNHPLCILEFKINPHTCEDCGKTCARKPVREFVWRGDRWQERCVECKRQRHPVSQKMLTQAELKRLGVWSKKRDGL